MSITCNYCTAIVPQEEIEWAQRRRQGGYFCELCEYFHYFDENRSRPTYKLFLEQSSHYNDHRMLKKPSVKLSKRLSPLRYPGGKSRLIDFMYHEMSQTANQTLYSPFAGGASMELAMLDAGIVDQIVLNDLDLHLMNFYRVCFYEPDKLIDLIDSKPLTTELYETAHHIITHDFNSYSHATREDMAYYYLINNRCSFSGIYNAGRMGGKNGTMKDLSSRWNPKTMRQRIKKLGEFSNRVTLTNSPYQDFIETHAWDDNGVFIIDPPYIEKAQSLYRHAFRLEDHYELFNYLSSFWHSHPACDFFVFYDKHPYLYDLPIPDDVEILARKFSIVNK